MRKSVALCILAAGIARHAISQTPEHPAEKTPAQYGIDEAKQLIAVKPKEYSGQILLASALVRRAQETSDLAYYVEAERAVAQVFALSPGNFDASKIEALILLGTHKYPEALSLASALNKKIPDDVAIYGLLTDANAELGNYKEAEVAAQWMLNLRPGNRPALLNVAQLRELFGELDGSYEVLDMALQSTAPTEKPERAAILNTIAHIRLLQGRVEEAEKFSEEALKTFPGYNPALGTMAEVRISQRRFEDAVTLFRQQGQAVSDPKTTYHLAEALEVAGQSVESKRTFEEFLKAASAETTSENNANRELTFYYVDHAHEPSKALEVARHEYSWRKDVYTLDAYAWALHANGDDSEARKQLNLALAVGVRDPMLLAHKAKLDHLTDSPATTNQ